MLGLRREVRAWKPDFTTGAFHNRYEICHQLSPPQSAPRRNAFFASFRATGRRRCSAALPAACGVHGQHAKVDRLLRQLLVDRRDFELMVRQTVARRLEKGGVQHVLADRDIVDGEVTVAIDGGGERDTAGGVSYVPLQREFFWQGEGPRRIAMLGHALLRSYVMRRTIHCVLLTAVAFLANRIAIGAGATFCSSMGPVCARVPLIGWRQLSWSIASPTRRAGG